MPAPLQLHRGGTASCASHRASFHPSEYAHGDSKLAGNQRCRVSRYEREMEFVQCSKKRKH